MGCKQSIVKGDSMGGTAEPSKSPSSTHRRHGSTSTAPGAAGAKNSEVNETNGPTRKPGSGGSSRATSTTGLAGGGNTDSKSHDGSKNDGRNCRCSTAHSTTTRPTNHQRHDVNSGGRGGLDDTNSPDDGSRTQNETRSENHFDPIPPPFAAVSPQDAGYTAGSPRSSSSPHQLQRQTSATATPVYRTTLCEHMTTDAAQAAEEYQAHLQAKKSAEEAKTTKIQLEMFDPIRPMDSFNVTHRALLGRCWDRRVPEFGPVSFVHAALAAAAEDLNGTDGSNSEDNDGGSHVCHHCGHSRGYGFRKTAAAAANPSSKVVDASTTDTNSVREEFSAAPRVRGASHILERHGPSRVAQVCAYCGEPSCTAMGCGGRSGSGTSPPPPMMPSDGSFTNRSIVVAPGNTPLAIGAGGVPRRSHWFSVAGITAGVGTAGISPTNTVYAGKGSTGNNSSGGAATGASFLSGGTSPASAGAGAAVMGDGTGVGSTPRTSGGSGGSGGVCLPSAPHAFGPGAAAAAQAYQELLHQFPTMPTVEEVARIPVGERVELANTLMLCNPRFYGIKSSYAFRVSAEEAPEEEQEDPGIRFLVKHGLCPARGVKVVRWNRVEFFSPNFATLTIAVAKTEGIAHLSVLEDKLREGRRDNKTMGNKSSHLAHAAREDSPNSPRRGRSPSSPSPDNDTFIPSPSLLPARDCFSLSFVGQHLITNGENISFATLAGHGHNDGSGGRGASSNNNFAHSRNSSFLHRSLMGNGNGSGGVRGSRSRSRLHDKGRAEVDTTWGTARHTGSLTGRACQFPEDSVLCLALEIPPSRLLRLPGVPLAVLRHAGFSGRGGGSGSLGSISPAWRTPVGSTIAADSIARFPFMDEGVRSAGSGDGGGHGSPLSDGSISNSDGHTSSHRSNYHRDASSSHLIGLTVSSFSISIDPFQWEQKHYTRYPVDVDGYKSSSRRDYGEGVITDIMYGGIMVVECSSAEAAKHLLDLLNAMKWNEERTTADILGDVKKRFRQYREGIAKLRKGALADGNNCGSHVVKPTPVTIRDGDAAPTISTQARSGGHGANGDGDANGVDSFQYRISHRIGGRPMRDRVELKQISVFMGDTVVEQAQTISVPAAGGVSHTQSAGSAGSVSPPPSIVPTVQQMDPDSTPSFSRVASAWVSLPAISAVLRTWGVHLLCNPQYAQPVSFFLQRFSGIAPVLQHTTLSTLFHMSGTPTDERHVDTDEEEGIGFFESDLAGYRGEGDAAMGGGVTGGAHVKRISRFNRFYASLPGSVNTSPAEHQHEMVKSASKETLAQVDHHSSVDGKNTPELGPAVPPSVVAGSGGGGSTTLPPSVNGGGIGTSENLLPEEDPFDDELDSGGPPRESGGGGDRQIFSQTAAPTARNSLDGYSDTVLTTGAHADHLDITDRHSRGRHRTQSSADPTGSVGDCGAGGSPRSLDIADRHSTFVFHDGSDRANGEEREGYRSADASMDVPSAAVTQTLSDGMDISSAAADGSGADGFLSTAVPPPTALLRTRRPTATGNADVTVASPSAKQQQQPQQQQLQLMERSAGAAPSTPSLDGACSPRLSMGSVAGGKKAVKRTIKRPPKSTGSTATAGAASPRQKKSSPRAEASTTGAAAAAAVSGAAAGDEPLGGGGRQPSSLTRASSTRSHELAPPSTVSLGQELEEVWRIADLEVRAQKQELAELVQERQRAEDAYRSLADQLRTLQRAFLPNCAVQELDLLFLYLKTALFEPEDLPHSRVFLSTADWLPVLTALWTSPANATRSIEIAYPLTSRDLPKIGVLSGLLFHKYAAAPLEQLRINASVLLGSPGLVVPLNVSGGGESGMESMAPRQGSSVLGENDGNEGGGGGHSKKDKRIKKDKKKRSTLLCFLSGQRDCKDGNHHSHYASGRGGGDEEEVEDNDESPPLVFSTSAATTMGSFAAGGAPPFYVNPEQARDTLWLLLCSVAENTRCVEFNLCLRGFPTTLPAKERERLRQLEEDQNSRTAAAVANLISASEGNGSDGVVTTGGGPSSTAASGGGVARPMKKSSSIASFFGVGRRHHHTESHVVLPTGSFRLRADSLTLGNFIVDTSIVFSDPAQPELSAVQTHSTLYLTPSPSRIGSLIGLDTADALLSMTTTSAPATLRAHKQLGRANSAEDPLGRPFAPAPHSGIDTGSPSLHVHTATQESWMHAEAHALMMPFYTILFHTCTTLPVEMLSSQQQEQAERIARGWAENGAAGALAAVSAAGYAVNPRVAHYHHDSLFTHNHPLFYIPPSRQRKLAELALTTCLSHPLPSPANHTAPVSVLGGGVDDHLPSSWGMGPQCLTHRTVLGLQSMEEESAVLAEEDARLFRHSDEIWSVLRQATHAFNEAAAASLSRTESGKNSSAASLKSGSRGKASATEGVSRWRRVILLDR